MAYDASLWIALDRIGENIGRDEQLNSVSVDDYPLDFMDIALVTKDNVPAKKKFREPKEDYVTFFTEKWKDGVRLAARARLSRARQSSANDRQRPGRGPEHGGDHGGDQCELDRGQQVEVHA